MEIQKIKIRRVGNSQGIVLPKSVMEAVGLKAGSEVDLVIEEYGLSILPPPPTLDELIASTEEGFKFSEANTGSAVGEEIE